jgi:hypothetical protein
MPHFKRLIRLSGLALIASTIVSHILVDQPEKLLGSALRSAVCRPSLERALEFQSGWYWRLCIASHTLSLSDRGLTHTEHPRERLGGRRVGRVDDNFYYCHDASGDVIQVPAGFKTDFASIPFFISWLFDSQGDHQEAGVVHDWLYAVGEKSEKRSRATADLVFRDMLAESRVNIVKRNVMYVAVRVAGFQFYNSGPTYPSWDTTWTIAKTPKPKTAVVEVLLQCQAFNEKYGLLGTARQ